MNVFDFVTLEEINELPEDNSSAFIQYVHLAQQRLKGAIAIQNAKSGTHAGTIANYQYSFMNVVAAAARRYDIGPLFEFVVPSVSNYVEGDYAQFSADLDNCLAGLLIDGRMRSLRNSVAIPDKIKDRIRAHLNGLREAVDAAALTKDRKSALLSRIDEFEAELERRRLNLLSVSLLTIAILGAPGAIWTSFDLVQKLTSNIIAAIADAKSTQDGIVEIPQLDAPQALLVQLTGEPPEHQSVQIEDKVDRERE